MHVYKIIDPNNQKDGKNKPKKKTILKKGKTKNLQFLRSNELLQTTTTNTTKGIRHL